MTVYTRKVYVPEKDISLYDFLELRHYKCEVRGPHCAMVGSQRHHGLIRRSKRNPELDALINYQCTCYVCHTETGHADSRENHDKFYELQCERYGKGIVDRWIEERREF